MKADPAELLVLPDTDPLKALLSTLGMMAAGFSGGALNVQDNSGGVQRPVLTPAGRLLLTHHQRQADASPAHDLYRASVAHAVAHWRHSTPGMPTNTLKPMGIAVVSAIEDVRVDRLLCRELPGVRRWFIEQLAPVPDPGDLSFAALMARMDRALLDANYQDDSHWVNKARRLFEETVAEHGLAAYPAFRAVASILANDLGQMRVRFDPQHHVVPSPFRDDNSFLWRYSEQNEEPDEALAIQQAAAPRQAVPSELDEGEVVEPDPAQEVELDRFVYPEWNHRIELWRRDWCTVIEKLPAWSDPVAPASQTAAPRSFNPFTLRCVRRLSRTHRLRRQWEGDDIDLNSAIEVQVDRRLHLQPEPRLFMRPGRETGASSILVLLDLSESTNDRAGETAASLLDLEKQAAVLLADATADTEDRVAIHGFSSNSRSEVSYYRLLEFGARLQGSARARLASVPGRHSTRMGAALRHATTHLQAETGHHRAILLITDGAPSDVDVFEPGYLIEDARAAVLQARQAGVRPFCIAVDKGAATYVRRIFGWRDHCIAENPRGLPVQLQRAYARLVAG